MTRPVNLAIIATAAAVLVVPALHTPRGVT